MRVPPSHSAGAVACASVPAPTAARHHGSAAQGPVLVGRGGGRRGPGLVSGVLGHRALVPVWFVSVGGVAMWWSAPTVTATLLLVVLVVVVFPVFVVTAAVRKDHRARVSGLLMSDQPRRRH